MSKVARYRKQAITECALLSVLFLFVLFEYILSMWDQ